MPRKRKMYVVGYDNDYNPVYGADREGRTSWVDTFTLAGARRYLPRLTDPNATVYKLVPVRTKKGK